MGGHQPYGIGPDGAAGEGVGGDVLGVEFLQEVEGAAAAGAFLGAGRGLEQGDDGVQVPVGVAAGRAAAVGGPLQALRPGGAVPQLPQRLLGRAAPGEQFAGLAQQQAEPLGTARVGGVVGHQALGLGERPGDQLVGGPRK